MVTNYVGECLKLFYDLFRIFPFEQLAQGIQKIAVKTLGIDTLKTGELL